MKTLIISGTVQRSEYNINQLTYDVVLFGQTKENPLCQLITYTKIDCGGYNEMQDIARDLYAKYFNTDLFNIISLENIRMI